MAGPASRLAASGATAPRRRWPGHEEQGRVFGEALPKGLRLKRGSTSLAGAGLNSRARHRQLGVSLPKLCDGRFAHFRTADV